MLIHLSVYFMLKFAMEMFISESSLISGLYFGCGSGEGRDNLVRGSYGTRNAGKHFILSLARVHKHPICAIFENAFCFCLHIGRSQLILAIKHCAEAIVQRDLQLQSSFYRGWMLACVIAHGSISLARKAGLEYLPSLRCSLHAALCIHYNLHLDGILLSLWKDN